MQFSLVPLSTLSLPIEVEGALCLPMRGKELKSGPS
jgi:hypothetical protein